MGDKAKTKLAVATVFVLIAAASLGILQNVLAKGTPWQAGYDHGCSDAQLPFYQSTW